MCVYYPLQYGLSCRGGYLMFKKEDDFRFDLQLFSDAGDDPLVDDDDDDDADAGGLLDAFDLDLDADDDDEDYNDTEVIPKYRVQQLIKERVNKAQRKYQRLADQFKEIFGVDPEEAMELAKQYQTTAGFDNAQLNYGVPQNNFVPDGYIPEGAYAQPAQSTYLAQDPVIADLLAWKENITRRLNTEREAMEFVQKFPGVTEIPPEVIARRNAGGVTLAEAYSIYLGNNINTHTANARREGAEAAKRNIQRNKAYSTEGANYFASSGANDVDILSSEEREFAVNVLGMSPKQYLRYKNKAQKYRFTE